jgi:hypothetical protein
MKNNHAIALLAALLLAACAKEYTFTPPASAEGRACVERCQGSQSSCRRDQDLKADRARTQCEADAARRQEQCQLEAPMEYAACLKFAKTDEDRAACTLRDCDQPACYSSPSYSLCERDYRACYENCGGKVGIRE